MIHCTPCFPFSPEIKSGMQPDTNAALFLDLNRMILDGIPVCISNNDVLLTPGLEGILPTKYIWNIVNVPHRPLRPFDLDNHYSWHQMQAGYGLEQIRHRAQRYGDGWRARATDAGRVDAVALAEAEIRRGNATATYGPPDPSRLPPQRPQRLRGIVVRVPGCPSVAAMKALGSDPPKARPAKAPPPPAKAPPLHFNQEYDQRRHLQE